MGVTAKETKDSIGDLARGQKTETREVVPNKTAPPAQIVYCSATMPTPFRVGSDNNPLVGLSTEQQQALERSTEKIFEQRDAKYREAYQAREKALTSLPGVIPQVGSELTSFAVKVDQKPLSLQELAQKAFGKSNPQELGPEHYRLLRDSAGNKHLAKYFEFLTKGSQLPPGMIELPPGTLVNLGSTPVGANLRTLTNEVLLRQSELLEPLPLLRLKEQYSACLKEGNAQSIYFVSAKTKVQPPAGEELRAVADTSLLHKGQEILIRYKDGTPKLARTTTKMSLAQLLTSNGLPETSDAALWFLRVNPELCDKLGLDKTRPQPKRADFDKIIDPLTEYRLRSLRHQQEIPALSPLESQVISVSVDKTRGALSDQEQKRTAGHQLDTTLALVRSIQLEQLSKLETQLADLSAHVPTAGANPESIIEGFEKLELAIAAENQNARKDDVYLKTRYEELKLRATEIKANAFASLGKELLLKASTLDVSFKQNKDMLELGEKLVNDAQAIFRSLGAQLKEEEQALLLKAGKQSAEEAKQSCQEARELFAQRQQWTVLKHI